MSIAVDQVCWTTSDIEKTPVETARWTISFSLTAQTSSTGRPILCTNKPAVENNEITQKINIVSRRPNVKVIYSVTQTTKTQFFTWADLGAGRKDLGHSFAYDIFYYFFKNNRKCLKYLKYLKINSVNK